MTNELRRIDRDRKRREDELLFLLLILSGRALNHTLVAAQHGFDTSTVIASVINGDESLNQSGAAEIIAASMADAHLDAIRRLGRMSGKSIARPSVEELILLYAPQATTAANAMIGTLQQATVDAMNEALQTGQNIRREIRDAFDSAGYTRGNPYAVDLGAERAVVTAYNAGMIAAAMEQDEVTGLRHISVLDDVTTDICEERAGLQLPKDHPYWLNNIPALHWNCRSVVLPIFGDFVESDALPVIPPMAGFGAMPAGFTMHLTA